MESYLALLEAAVGPDMVGERGIDAMIVDSFEAGWGNWTDGMFDRFRSLRGYDLKPWLPVLAGHVIEDARTSEGLLGDFRQTLGNLIAQNHYDVIADMLRQRGLTSYAESHENGRAYVGDGMAAKAHFDVPTSAIWAEPGVPTTGFEADIRESASVANIHGRKYVASETFTVLGATYAYAPENLRPVADLAFVLGINRIIGHTSVHQPDDRLGPGLALGPHGQWFTRKETWADFAGPWVDYLSRSCYLLQQGRTVADIACLYAEDSNITALFGKQGPVIPKGYAFDYVNAEALTAALIPANGWLTAKSGMSYRLLVIDPSCAYMSLALLRRIGALVDRGVKVVGARPSMLPSLVGGEAEFEALAERLWSSGAIAPAARAIEFLGEPDALCLTPGVEPFRFLHRSGPIGDVYFLTFGTGEARRVEVSLRSADKALERWHADSGLREPLSYRAEGGRMIVSLDLEPNDSVLLIQQAPRQGAARTVPVRRWHDVAEVEGPWRLTLSLAGGEREFTFDALLRWDLHADADLRYFSGTGTYRFGVTLGKDAAARALWLDLGEVKNVAEVSVNGQVAGIAWKVPFRVSLGGKLRAGRNEFVVRVANLWPNRMIGDKQPGAGTPQAWASVDDFKAESPLLPSGLLGPVKIVEHVRS